MGEDWTKFQAKVLSDLHPILVRAGYTLQSAEEIDDADDDEGNEGFVFVFEKDNMPLVVIDVLEWISFESGVRKDFNWLRVHIGLDRLKVFMGLASDTDMILYDGWKWVTDAELDACIEEIAKGLKAYLDTH